MAKQAAETRTGPTKEQVYEARRAANLTQEAAAGLALLGSGQRWSEYERGERNMEASRFELFQIKAGQHSEFGPLRRAPRTRVTHKDPSPLQEDRTSNVVAAHP